MAITTGSNTAFIEAQIQSDFILRVLHDGLLPAPFYRNVSDFVHGTQIRIPTIGEAVIQEMSENTPPVYNAIETGFVTLSMTDSVGDAYFITQNMREDGTNIEALLQARAMESVRAIQEYNETRGLAVLNAAQTASNLNSINGHAHRFVAADTNDCMGLVDLQRMKLSFDKAQVPYANRVGIITPTSAAALLQEVNATFPVNSNPTMQAILEGGFSRDHEFVMNIAGWHLITSNRLPAGITETINSDTVTLGDANIFMCIADDNTKPLMQAWRRMPQVESKRNMELDRDDFVTRLRFGLGVQRVDTLGVILTHPTNIT